ncbi:hypothetical protein BBAD15_g5167 [Beauveria bassiana D1-5]|uniref:Uncharacterized protein n=1 Tax=Beauveria bassiana D1-5 TaxID=1245745 RepID=A0A0A2VPA7_BEABA|nr:hypothetical protein BBAD15_g5167 [Beauveria bassiana D1-5]
MRSAALLLGLCAWPAAAAKATHSTVLYQQFFPAWDEMLKGYLEHNCQENITNYRNASFNDTHISYAVFDCLLQQFPEFRKSPPTRSRSAAQCSFTRNHLFYGSNLCGEGGGLIKTAIEASARQLPLYSGQTIRPRLPDPVSIRDAVSPSTSGRGQQRVPYVSAVRMDRVLLLTHHRVPPRTLAWNGGAAASQRLGRAALKRAERGEDTTPGWASRLKSCIENETTPSAFAKKLPVENRAAGPAPFFSAVIAALYAGAPVHLLYGTLVLSSLTFISAFDSIAVVAFYAMSTIVSKAILYFECAGIQAVASQDLEATTEGEQMNGYSAL